MANRRKWTKDRIPPEFTNTVSLFPPEYPKRALRCFKRLSIHTLRELLEYEPHFIAQCDGVGETTVETLKNLIYDHYGLDWK